jgi:pyridoxine kinase
MNVLAIQSAVAYGHVGNSAAVLPLQRLGHDVWAVNTVSFSNHPAHGGYRGRVTPPDEVAELIRGIEERGALARCDAVVSGYLGEVGTAEVVRDAVGRVRAANPRALYCCDPVIGEARTGVYVRAGIPEAIRDRLVPVADVVKPNLFELGYLAGRPVATLAEALDAADRVQSLGPGVVVATGLPLADAPDRLGILAVGAEGAWLARVPQRRVPGHGSGDLFTALFVGVYLGRRDLAAALGHAVNALDAILAETERRQAKDLALVAAQDAITRPPVSFPPLPIERLR